MQDQENFGQRVRHRREELKMSQEDLAKLVGISQVAINKIENGGNTRFGRKIAQSLSTNLDFLELGVDATSPAPAPHEATNRDGQESDWVITEYDTGGSMGSGGFNLADNPPGFIRSWRVTHDWLRLNVPTHTGVKNLAIVTGFGHSMKPIFNPGDPLLIDTGVKVIDHEGIFFFRVGDEGFIKLIQRVPEFDGPGVRLRVISKNPDFPPYDLSPKNPHLEVLGKVLTVWRSEQF